MKIKDLWKSMRMSIDENYPIEQVWKEGIVKYVYSGPEPLQEAWDILRDNDDDPSGWRIFYDERRRININYVPSSWY